MLEDTYERHILGKMYADERVGLYVIRGENLVLLGEIDVDKEASQAAMREVPLETLLKEKAAKRQEKVIQICFA
jgi:U6 snRNA-associated Sm-like protein LSm1